MFEIIYAVIHGCLWGIKYLIEGLIKREIKRWIVRMIERGLNPATLAGRRRRGIGRNWSASHAVSQLMSESSQSTCWQLPADLGYIFDSGSKPLQTSLWFICEFENSYHCMPFSLLAAEYFDLLKTYCALPHNVLKRFPHMFVFLERFR